jgi:plasmid stabilization system protein ParE
VTPVTQLMISHRAAADMVEIGEDIEAASDKASADKFLSRMTATMKKLARIPNAAGRLVPRLGSDVRSHPFKSYAIFMTYDPLSDTLVVLRVMHGRRRVTKAHFRN